MSTKPETGRSGATKGPDRVKNPGGRDLGEAPGLQQNKFAMQTPTQQGQNSKGGEQPHQKKFEGDARGKKK